jgi:hypothetical protein
MAASLQNNVLPDNVERWYSNATVRNSARILVPLPGKGEYLFPRSRQILAEHPLLTALGDAAVAYVLAQSSYKYMYEIGLLETRFVIDCSLDIINYKIGGANDDERREAITIVIDEGYHAYVALDFIIQMKALTGIEPIEIPQTNGNLDAVRRAFAILPPQTHRAFQLLSVCLAEHTLTKDLLSIGREKETTRSFTQVMTDHVSDEGRHANYFAKLTTSYWAGLDEVTRTQIGVMLPDYLDDYLAGDAERAFDRKVLLAAGLNADQVDTAIADTQAQYQSNMDDYIVKTKHNLVKLLQRMGVLSHPATQQAFRAHGVSL